MIRSVRSAVLLLGLLMAMHDAGAAGLERELAYGADPKQRLDLSIPAARGFATVIFIHGGSLSSGDKADDDYGKVGAALVGSGLACASVNYRLAPEHPWPAQAEDVAAAIVWVHDSIGSRGGDPKNLFLVGHSSGAMLAALIATDERYLAHHDIKASVLRGVVPMGSIMWDDELEQALQTHGRARVEEAFGQDPGNGMYGNLDTYLDHWPIRHMRPGLPPFLFLIAEAEQEQPPVLKTNKKFVEDARALGNWAEYKVLSGRTHYSAIRKLSEPGDPVLTLLQGFVRRFSAVADDSDTSAR